MKKLIDILVFIGAILTFPIWLIFIIIILFSIPKDYFDKIDQHREATE